MVIQGDARSLEDGSFDPPGLWVFGNSNLRGSATKQSYLEISGG